MIVEKYIDGEQSRKVLIGMITDSAVIGRIAAKWGEDGNLFDSKWENLIGGWAVRFFQRYNKAPGRAIEIIFGRWAAKHKHDEDTIKLVEMFLGNLSDEYERNGEAPNAQYVIDQAGECFRRSHLLKLSRSLKANLDADQLDKAEGKIEAYSRIELGVGAGVKLAVDEEAVRSTFDEKHADDIVEYHGPLETFFHEQLERDCFVVFQAPPKASKTFFLMDLAYRAMTQRRRVVLFEIGDLSERQAKARMLTRIAKHPYRSQTGWPCVAKYPTSIKPPRERNMPARIVHESKEFKKRLDGDIAWAACQEVMKREVRSDKDYFRLSAHANFTISAMGVKSIVQAWAREGWLADVVIVDYADLLAPPAGHFREKRDQIDTTWQQLRTMNQEYHNLLVVATQANAASFNKRTQDRSNFSGDNRKLAHATGVVGINVTGKEKSLGLVRLNWIVAREGGLSPWRCIHVAQCLPLANPAVISCFDDFDEEYKEDKESED